MDISYFREFVILAEIKNYWQRPSVCTLVSHRCLSILRRWNDSSVHRYLIALRER